MQSISLAVACLCDGFQCVGMDMLIAEENHGLAEYGQVSKKHVCRVVIWHCQMVLIYIFNNRGPEHVTSGYEYGESARL